MDTTSIHPDNHQVRRRRRARRSAVIGLAGLAVLALAACGFSPRRGEHRRGRYA